MGEVEKQPTRYSGCRGMTCRILMGRLAIRKEAA